MAERYFQFKKFGVCHSVSAMKVGVDSVLLGAWADITGANRILDAGAGCGLLALMCAQRNVSADIEGVEIDTAAACEAAANFANSPWGERLKCVASDFNAYCTEYRHNQSRWFDAIISNPPYFKSGVNDITDNRLLARHQQEFTPLSILRSGKLVLREGGTVHMVLPVDIAAAIENQCREEGFILKRKCEVRGRKELAVKRILIEFLLTGNPEANSTDLYPPVCEHLVLEERPGMPTETHKSLCRDFYLKF